MWGFYAHHQRDGADQEHDGHENQKPEHLDLRRRGDGGQFAEGASGSRLCRVRLGSGCCGDDARLLAHTDQRAAHGAVTQHRDSDQQQHEAAVQERVRGSPRVRRAPVQEAPRPREVLGVTPEAETGHRAQHPVHHVDREQGKPRHRTVHVLRVEKRVADCEVALHGHGAQDGHPGRAEEQHGEGEEVAERRAAGPPTRHVRGDHHRTGEARPQEVRHRHAAHQRVKRRLLLLPLGHAQHRHGHQVPEHSDSEHGGRDDQRARVQAQNTRRGRRRRGRRRMGQEHRRRVRVRAQHRVGHV